MKKRSQVEILENIHYLHFIQVTNPFIIALFSLTGFAWSHRLHQGVWTRWIKGTHSTPNLYSTNHIPTRLWAAKNTYTYLQDMTKILRNVQCLLLGLKDLTWRPHTSHRSPGIIPILHMSLNLKIHHNEPVHSWKISSYYVISTRFIPNLAIF